MGTYKTYFEALVDIEETKRLFAAGLLSFSATVKIIKYNREIMQNEITANI